MNIEEEKTTALSKDILYEKSLQRQKLFVHSAQLQLTVHCKKVHRNVRISNLTIEDLIRFIEFFNENEKIERQHLIILDDFGIQPLDAQSRSMLMEIIEDRHQNASTLITSQVPVAKWVEVIAENTIADAIMDRLIHNAHRLELKGESLRKKSNLKLNEIDN